MIKSMLTSHLPYIHVDKDPIMMLSRAKFVILNVLDLRSGLSSKTHGRLN